ncbi:unnamed protein product [Trifolium pratense]|uniref:Uncharacterized protein n=1 Tax=Trifolium pratense TaxID=57577 RepID=A0ACB0IPM1_TRIPR|nr:unnamed protein product [Trifolium pratense]
MKGSNKGHVPMVVGKGEENQEDMEKIWVSIKVIHHPKIIKLLDQSVKEYGYPKGVLRIRCGVENFKAIFANISNTSDDQLKLPAPWNSLINCIG